MSAKNGKSQQTTWIKFPVLVLLLCTSGLIITACQNSEQESQSIEQETQQEVESSPAATPLSPEELKYKQQGQDTTDDDDPE
ncbi:hypothetical protein [Lyngbya aestuarii]|uniref:hypothetical protein n=1 Tax=Lyngbya aestuarii TaxID=118322 RepID=UPI00403E18DE